MSLTFDLARSEACRVCGVPIETTTQFYSDEEYGIKPRWWRYAASVPEGVRETIEEAILQGKESGCMLVTGHIPGVREHSVWYRWGY